LSASLVRQVVQVVRERGIRAAARELHLHRDTVRRYARNSAELPPVSRPLERPAARGDQ
jgi:hypothetical protein